MKLINFRNPAIVAGFFVLLTTFFSKFLKKNSHHIHSLYFKPRIPFNASALLLEAFTGIDDLFVANFGCGRSGNDILNNVLEKSPKEIQSRVRGVYFDPKSCDLPLSGLTFINSALDAKTAARFVTAGVVRTSSFWILKVDIDSIDCDIVREILRAGHHPAVIIIETMGCFPPPVRFELFSTSHSMSHEPFSAINHGESPHPQNCCLYGCSVQSAIDVVTETGLYVAVRLYEGDAWFVRKDTANRMDVSSGMFDPSLAAGDATFAFQSEEAAFMKGYLAIFNLHLEHMFDWTRGLQTDAPKTFDHICETFSKRCNHTRLRESSFQLSLDAYGALTCPWHVG